MKIFFLGVILFIGGSLYGQEGIHNYLWNYISVSGKLSQKTELNFSQKLHYSIDDALIDYMQTDIILYYNFTKHFTFGAALRNAYIYSDEKWVAEITPQLYGVYKTSFKDITVNFSNRFDYRTFDTVEKQSRYRNKLTIVSPVSLVKFGLRPYIAEEMFVKLNGDGFYNYRLFGGMYLFNIRFLKVDLFYCYNKYEWNNAWTHQNVGGIYLYFTI